MIPKPDTKKIIEVRGLTKTFIDKGGIETRVLRGLDFTCYRGEFIAIMGRSGAGKSTFLYQMSLLDKPTSGLIKIEEHEVSALTEEEKTTFRLNKLGYVFQDYALIPELTALENIMIPLLMQGYKTPIARMKALQSLSRIGLEARQNNLPSGLSGGEQQRVAVARAVAHAPEIIFADEPTANLDTYSGKLVLDLLLELNKNGQTIVMVTHEEEYGHMADRIVRLSDGQIVA
jgi:putative ABC transport system ATP-binding protein